MLSPSPDYRRALAREMEGTDVAALQINLPTGVDGDFGPHTEQVVKTLQKRHHLTEDGIAGVITQRAIIREACAPVQTEQRLPGGLLMSLASNESGFVIPAFTDHPSDSGFDLGPFQRSFPKPGSQADYTFAYSAESMGEATGARVRANHDRYADPWPVDGWYVDHIAEGRKGRFAWQLAVLSHNWPAAADHLHAHGTIFRDATQDIVPAQWIIDATRGRLATPREWIRAYIERSTTYVQWPTN